MRQQQLEVLESREVLADVLGNQEQPLQADLHKGSILLPYEGRQPTKYLLLGTCCLPSCSWDCGAFLAAGTIQHPQAKTATSCEMFRLV